MSELLLHTIDNEIVPCWNVGCKGTNSYFQVCDNGNPDPVFRLRTTPTGNKLSFLFSWLTAFSHLQFDSLDSNCEAWATAGNSSSVLPWQWSPVHQLLHNYLRITSLLFALSVCLIIICLASCVDSNNCCPCHRTTSATRRQVGKGLQTFYSSLIFRRR